MFFGGGEIPLGIDPDDEFYGIDWSKIDKPVKLTVTERVDIDNLQAFAGSEEGKKEISTFYPEEEDNNYKFYICQESLKGHLVAIMMFSMFRIWNIWF